MEGIFFSEALQSKAGYSASPKGPINPSNLILEGPVGKGRPNSLSEEKRKEMLSVYYSRPLSLRVLAKMYGVSRMTILRVVREAPAPQVTI